MRNSGIRARQCANDRAIMRWWIETHGKYAFAYCPICGERERYTELPWEVDKGDFQTPDRIVMENIKLRKELESWKEKQLNAELRIGELKLQLKELTDGR